MAGFIKKNKILIASISLLVASFIASPQTSAGAVEGFIPGRIIDDVVMANKQSMSVEQIQAFLDSKVPVCDTDGTANYGGTGQTRAEYTAANGLPLPPYTCLKGYTENSKSSAQIIYDAAQDYNINPQVLLVVLQKEQSLITDDWPWPSQYRSATGYGCSDSAPCEEKYYGFTNQVRNVAEDFRMALDNSTDYHSGFLLGTNYIQFSPNASCGGTVVNIQNRATLALYTYTPYQPNQAAIGAGYGTGDSCSAYGNRNFYLYFTDWFGSPYGTIPQLRERHNQIADNIGQAVEAGYCNAEQTLCWQHFTKGYIIYSPQTGAWESKGAIRNYWAAIGYQNGAAGLPTGPEVWDETNKTWSQTYQNGIIIGTDRTGWRLVLNSINKRWQELGAATSGIGMPTENPAWSGSIIWQKFERGYIIYSPQTGAWESKGAIRSRWASINYQNGEAGLPTGPEVWDETNKTWSQTYQNGIIIGTDRTGYWFLWQNFNNRWQALGAASSSLGMPEGVPANIGDVAWQKFERGFIVSSPLGTWESKGAIRTYWGSIGYQNGIAGLPNGPEVYNEATDTWSQEYQFGTIYFSAATGWSMTQKAY